MQNHITPDYREKDNNEGNTPLEALLLCLLRISKRAASSSFLHGSQMRTGESPCPLKTILLCVQPLQKMPPHRRQ